MKKKSLIVPCPTCGKKLPWSTENESRPFCSPRCKLIDLGEWADESRRIPGDPSTQIIPDDNDED